MSRASAAADPATLDAARERVTSARRTARLARIAAAPALRERAVRRTRRLRNAVLIAAAIATAAVVTLVVLEVTAHHHRAQTDAGDAAATRAGAAVAAMLTADPGKASEYADRIIALSVGERAQLLQSQRDVLVTEIAALSTPSTGQVIDSGLITDPSDGDDIGSRASVLVVAAASNPELLGAGDAESGRSGPLTVDVTMQRTDEGWRVAEVSAI